MQKRPKKIFIICNGNLSNKNFHKRILRDASLIICADGGANNLKKISIIPDYVVGDMDSIEKKLLSKLKKNKKTTVITDPNQDKTDTELAIKLAQSFKPREIIMLCAIGTRLDHTFANFLCLEKINKKIKARIIDEKNEIVLVDHESLEIYGKKKDNISVIPLTDVAGLNYHGLKWPIRHKSFRQGWHGVSNEMLSNRAKISVTKGRLLVFKSKD